MEPEKVAKVVIVVVFTKNNSESLRGFAVAFRANLCNIYRIARKNKSKKPEKTVSS